MPARLQGAHFHFDGETAAGEAGTLAGCLALAGDGVATPDLSAFTETKGRREPGCTLLPANEAAVPGTKLPANEAAVPGA